MKKFKILSRALLMIALLVPVCLAAGCKPKVPEIPPPDDSNVYIDQPVYGGFKPAALDKEAVSGNLAGHVGDIEQVLYNGEVFTGVWSGSATVVVMPAAVILQIGGNGTGWISIGKTDYGYFDYKIEGNAIYMLYHLNIANDKGDSYKDMGTVTINEDGSLTADIKVSLGSIKGVKLSVRESVTGLTLNENGTGVLDLSTGAREFAYTEESGVYTFKEAGEVTFTGVRVSAKGIEINYRYVHTNSSSLATYTEKTVVIKIS